MRYINWFATLVGYITIMIGLRIAYQTVPPMVKKMMAKPKFQVGECIRSFDSFDHKIIEIFPSYGLQGPQYGYTVGAECYDHPDYFDCSTSVGDMATVNESSVKIECPKR